MTRWKRRAFVVLGAVLVLSMLYLVIFSERGPAPAVVGRPVVEPTVHDRRPSASPQQVVDAPSEHPAGPQVRFQVRVEGGGQGLQGMIRYPEGDEVESISLQAEGWALVQLEGPSGGGMMRAEALPAAPFYQILLWDEEGRWAVARRQAPGYGPDGRVLDAGVLRVNEPAGIDLAFRNVPVGEDRFLVRLQRTRPPDDVEEELFALLLQAAKPELAEALMPVLEGGEVNDLLTKFPALEAAASEPMRLAPLPPGAVLQVHVSDREGGRRGRGEVAIQADTITSMTLDVTRAFAGELQGCLSVRVRVEEEGSGKPLRGLAVEQSGGANPGFYTTDENGVIVIPCVSRLETMVLRVAQDPPRPEHHDFFFRADRYREVENVADATWRMPLWRQVVGALDAEAEARLRKESVEGYPLFSLQRLDEQGWSDLEHPPVVQDGSVLSATVETSGTYRLAIALGPLLVRVSEAVEVPAESGTFEAAGDWEMPPANDLLLRVVTSSTGEPAAGVRLEVRGTAAVGIPASGVTDEEGLVSLGPVNSSQIFVVLYRGEGREERVIALNPPPAEGMVVVEVE